MCHNGGMRRNEEMDHFFQSRDLLKAANGNPMGNALTFRTTVQRDRILTVLHLASSFRKCTLVSFKQAYIFCESSIYRQRLIQSKVQTLRGKRRLRPLSPSCVTFTQFTGLYYLYLQDNVSLYLWANLRRRPTARSLANSSQCHCIPEICLIEETAFEHYFRLWHQFCILSGLPSQNGRQVGLAVMKRAI